MAVFALGCLPQVFDAAAAGEWDVTLQVRDHDRAVVTLEIKDGVCVVSPGEAGTPDATIAFHDHAFWKLLRGNLTPEEALEQGHVSVPAPELFTKFVEVFPPASVVALVDAENDRERSDPARHVTEADFEATGVDRPDIPALMRGLRATAQGLVGDDEELAEKAADAGAGAPDPEWALERRLKLIDDLESALQGDDLLARRSAWISAERDLKLPSVEMGIANLLPKLRKLQDELELLEAAVATVDLMGCLSSWRRLAGILAIEDPAAVADLWRYGLTAQALRGVERDVHRRFCDAAARRPQPGSHLSQDLSDLQRAFVSHASYDRYGGLKPQAWLPPDHPADRRPEEGATRAPSGVASAPEFIAFDGERLTVVVVHGYDAENRRVYLRCIYFHGAQGEEEIVDRHWHPQGQDVVTPSAAAARWADRVLEALGRPPGKAEFQALCEELGIEDPAGFAAIYAE